MKLFFFILTAIFLVIGKTTAYEITIKDCYDVSKYGKNQFDKKRYTQYFFTINPKNKTIVNVWSYTDNAFDDQKDTTKFTKKNNIVNYKLEFIDNNFAIGKNYSLSGNLLSEITIDLKKYYVENLLYLNST
jgi:hypothetical protein